MLYVFIDSGGFPWGKRKNLKVQIPLKFHCPARFQADEMDGEKCINVGWEKQCNDPGTPLLRQAHPALSEVYSAALQPRSQQLQGDLYAP